MLVRARLFLRAMFAEIRSGRFSESLDTGSLILGLSAGFAGTVLTVVPSVIYAQSGLDEVVEFLGTALIVVPIAAVASIIVGGIVGYYTMMRGLNEQERTEMWNELEAEYGAN